MPVSRSTTSGQKRVDAASREAADTTRTAKKPNKGGGNTHTHPSTTLAAARQSENATATTASKASPPSESQAQTQTESKSGKQTWHSRQRYRQNPSRGGPAILLTCEVAREVKCEREGREILQYYLNRSQPTPQTPPEKKLTLDEELAILQQQTNKPDRGHGPFQLFDTGCSGTVFLMYKHDEHNDVIDSATGTITKSPVETTTSTVWDPVATVRDVLQDIQGTDTDSSVSRAVPSSRFVTRMIPIQTTCFTSVKEIESVLPRLLQSHIDKEDKTTNEEAATAATTPRKTFCIHVKKRNFDQLSRQDLIDAAVPIVTRLTEWKVKLEGPDYVVWIEVCKNLMGVSVLGQDIVHLAKNFNIAELRHHHHHQQKHE